MTTRAIAVVAVAFGLAAAVSSIGKASGMAGATVIPASPGVAGMASRGTRVSFEFTPSTVPRHAYAAGAIHVHLRTAVPRRTRASRIQFDFDDHFKFAPGSAPTCHREDISNSQVDMATAMARCGSASIGSGTAKATDGSTTLEPCVLVFNGAREDGAATVLLFVRVRFSPPVADCSHPAANHSGNTSLLVRGFLAHSRLRGYRKALRFNRLNGAEPLPLTDLDLTLQKGDYISAHCSSADSERGWRLRTKVGYVKPRRVQRVEATQRCRRGP
ncbi:MAG TPA: hypothetical protein VH391_05450 [Solirubrobacterales bacterium]